MIRVRIDEDEFLDMLINRVEYWTQSKDVINLYEEMYKNYIESGCFDDIEMNINAIVDNDFVNYCSVIEEGEEGFNEVLEVYKNQGLGDCSCEDCNGSFIEAVSEDEKMILIRW